MKCLWPAHHFGVEAHIGVDAESWLLHTGCENPLSIPRPDDGDSHPRWVLSAGRRAVTAQSGGGCGAENIDLRKIAHSRARATSVNYLAPLPAVYTRCSR